MTKIITFLNYTAYVLIIYSSIMLIKALCTHCYYRCTEHGRKLHALVKLCNKVGTDEIKIDWGVKPLIIMIVSIIWLNM